MGKQERNKTQRGTRYKTRDDPCPTGPCPTPEKRKHSTRAFAKLSKRQQTRESGVSLRTYKCVCGCFHVGTSAHVQTRAEARSIAKRKLERIEQKKSPPA